MRWSDKTARLSAGLFLLSVAIGIMFPSFYLISVFIVVFIIALWAVSFVDADMKE